MSQQLQTRDINTFRTMLEKASPKLAEVAPKHLKVERLTRLLLSSMSRNPKIMQCSPESVLQFAMSCSTTGLEPIGAGGAWAIPYENRKNGTVELQFIPDYRGLVNCAKRAECIKDAYAEVVYEKDEFDYELGLEPRLIHRPARGERGVLEAAYCIIVFPDDTKRFVVMGKEEIEGIRKRSRASDVGPWRSDPAEMWKKTVVRRAMKPFAGASQSLDAAIQADDAATGLVDVTPRAPVPPPPSLDEPKVETPVEQEPAPVEDNLPMGDEAPAKAPAPAAAEGEIPEDATTIFGAIEAIDFPKKSEKTGKMGPFKIHVQGQTGTFDTFSESVANAAQIAYDDGGDAEIIYTEKINGKYTNRTLHAVRL